MSKARRFIFRALLGGLLAMPAFADSSGPKKAVQHADKAFVSGVRELGKGFKKASQAVDGAAKAGNKAVRRAAKGQGQ